MPQLPQRGLLWGQGRVYSCTSDGLRFGDLMADNFKCPKCGSGRTKPLSMAISGGTRGRSTVGISRRSLWGSSSTYKSDLVSSPPQRPSNGAAYLWILLGVFG